MTGFSRQQEVQSNPDPEERFDVVYRMEVISIQSKLSPPSSGPGRPGLREVQACLGGLFAGMNALYDTLGLPAAMNERISQEVAQLIENALE
ncbi:MAG: hypothetical protein EOM26_13575 [Alphaproteobacteria bacterium]|jgi:hypothetical protein|nr:hypothetical protein [Alphaproteobacteria bacterium]